MDEARGEDADDLTGELLRLSPLTRSEFPLLFEVLGHPDVFAGGWGGGPAAWSPSYDEFSVVVQSWLPWDTGEVYGVHALGDGRLVGVTALAVHAGTTATVRWTGLQPGVWGTGVNDDLMLVLLGRLFDQGIERVAMTMDVLNVRARAAAERLGAGQEGIRRHTGRRADGTWRDEAVYSVLSGEWPRVSELLTLRRTEHLGRD